MTGIYWILFFIVPGVLIKSFEESITISIRKETSKNTVYENLCGIVILSVFSSTISILIFMGSRILFGDKTVNTIDSFIHILNGIKEFVLYIVCMLIATAVVGMLNKCIIRKVLHAVKNRISEKQTGVKEAYAEEVTIWEDLFLNKDRVKNGLIATIYKDGQYITSGFIQSFNAGYDPKRELELVRTKEIEKILHDDKLRDDEDKWLGYVRYEYVDIDDGVLIKFYEPNKVYEHWDEIKY